MNLYHEISGIRDSETEIIISFTNEALRLSYSNFELKVCLCSLLIP